MIMSDSEITWISTYGGRFIALPDSSLAMWQGFPDDGRGPLDTSHDYGRACDTIGYATTLQVGETTALVFGENDYGGVYSEDQIPLIFEWVYADSADDVLRAIKELPQSLHSDSTLKFKVESDHLNVFDSAFAGCEYESQHSCRFSIKPGHYSVASTLYEPSENIRLIIHRFLRD